MTTSYFFGRTQGQIAVPYQGEHQLFAAHLLDGTTLAKAQYAHCTFANVSFKDVKNSGAQFTNCVFLNCYFRKSEWRSVHFAGCKFVECLFPGIRIDNVTFEYAIFQRCYIDPGEMAHSLPGPPNLRRDLAANLAHEAAGLGDSASARLYRQWAIQAREDHLWAACRGENAWYREHFPLPRNLAAGLTWIASRMNGVIWGYGERWGVLLRNLAILVFLLFRVSFWLLRDGLRPIGAAPAGWTVGWQDVLFLSIDSFLPLAGVSNVMPSTSITRGLTALEVLFGLIGAGLLVAYAFRSISRE